MDDTIPERGGTDLPFLPFVDRERAIGTGAVGLCRQARRGAARVLAPGERRSERCRAGSVCPGGGVGGSQQVLERDHVVPQMSVSLHASVASGRLRSQPPDQSPDFVNRPGGEAVAGQLEALQVFRQPHLEPQDLQGQVGVFQESLALPRVLGPDQRLQQGVQVAFDPLAQDKAVIAGEPARVVAGPEDQVIRFRDNPQFLGFFH